MMTQENMLARYGVLRELGRGGVGAVYAARDRETGAVVALKRLDPALLSKSDASLASRFLKHARAARHLKHRNIVKVYDAGEVGGTVYVAMEMLEGQSLRKILDAGPMPMARAIRVAHELAGGLAHAHLQGVVHGALKPTNVFVSGSGVVKISDFGLGEAALLPVAQVGCASYLSPEQVRGGPVDHRCDLFSLGALFYEMLTQRAPFEGGAPKQILENILHAKLPPPSELNPHVPRALDAMVFRMLAREPAGRMPGAPIVLRELQRLEEGLGLGPGASAGIEEPAASVPPATPEPTPRTREPASRTPEPMPRAEPSRLRERAPLQEAPRAARHGEGRGADEFRIRANAPAAEQFQHRNRVPDPAPFDHDLARIIRQRESGRERASGSRPAIVVGALALAVLGFGLAGFIYYSGERGIAVSRMQEAPPAAPKPSQPTALPPVAESATEALPLPAAPAAPQASAPRSQADEQTEQEPSEILSAADPTPQKPLAAEQTASATATRAPELPRAMPPVAKEPEPQPGGTAQVVMLVSPRGEVYLNGKHLGTTPPLTTFRLDPGMHRIEVRSGSRKPYLTYMTVQAGEVRRIRHDFSATRAVLPPKRASWQNGNRPAR